MKGQNKLIFVFLALLAFECLVYASTSKGCLPNSKAKKKVSKTAEFGFVVGVGGFAKYGKKFESKNRFGDDAWFYATRTDAEAIGIADGVGSWALDKNVKDTSKFATTLMDKCRKFFTDKIFFDKTEFAILKNYRFNSKNPTQFLSLGLQDVKKRNIFGSCTACLIILDKISRRLYTTNLGDSGFWVIRNRALFKESKLEYHDFNCPFQLGNPPKCGRYSDGDSPNKGAKEDFIVEVGDVIMLATDGVFDNIYREELIPKLIKLQGVKDKNTIEAAAKDIAELAHNYSQDPKYVSPFEKSAADQPDAADYTGGKEDDITVILATIVAK